MIILFGGGDAGGIEIYIGSDGKVHFKRIPGWDPEAMLAVETVAQLANYAHVTEDARLKAELNRTASEILNAPDIREQIKEYGGAERQTIGV
jgi:hypothetical protein